MQAYLWLKPFKPMLLWLRYPCLIHVRVQVFDSAIFWNFFMFLAQNEMSNCLTHVWVSSIQHKYFWWNEEFEQAQTIYFCQDGFIRDTKHASFQRVIHNYYSYREVTCTQLIAHKVNRYCSVWTKLVQIWTYWSNQMLR